MISMTAGGCGIRRKPTNRDSIFEELYHKRKQGNYGLNWMVICGHTWEDFSLFILIFLSLDVEGFFCLFCFALFTNEKVPTARGKLMIEKRGERVAGRKLLSCQRSIGFSISSNLPLTQHHQAFSVLCDPRFLMIATETDFGDL